MHGISRKIIAFSPNRTVEWDSRYFGRKLKPETIIKFRIMFKSIFAQPKYLQVQIEKKGQK